MIVKFNFGLLPPIFLNIIIVTIMYKLEQIVICVSRSLTSVPSRVYTYVRHDNSVLY